MCHPVWMMCITKGNSIDCHTVRNGRSEMKHQHYKFLTQRDRYTDIFVYSVHQGAEVHYGLNIRTFVSTISTTYKNV
jgi:hypothetical protein